MKTRSLKLRLKRGWYFFRLPSGQMIFEARDPAHIYLQKVCIIAYDPLNESLFDRSITRGKKAGTLELIEIQDAIYRELGEAEIERQMIAAEKRAN